MYSSLLVVLLSRVDMAGVSPRMAPAYGSSPVSHVHEALRSPVYSPLPKRGVRVRRFFVPLIGLSATLAASPDASAQSRAAIFNPSALTAQQQLSREIYQELVEMNTGVETGNVTTAAVAMAARCKAASIPDADLFVGGPRPEKHNVVARIRGRGGPNAPKPLLLLAHIDVVEAPKADWSPDLDPFVPDRDIIIALSADEERGPANGVDWLLKNHKELIDAAIVINEGSGGTLLPELMQNVVRITKELWGEMPIILTMSTGATDSRFFRALGVPAFGVSGLFADPTVDSRAHGRDERMGIKSYYEGQEFLYRLTKALSADVLAQ